MRIYVISSTMALVAMWSATAVAKDLQRTSATRSLTDYVQTAPAKLEFGSGGCAAGGCAAGSSCDSCDGGFGNGNFLESCGPDCACSACCTQKKMYFVDVESTYFRYHRADGVRIDGGDPDYGVEFGFEYSPRITAGFYGCDGFGVRARWWKYDHAEPALNENFGHMGVDTYNIDIEFVDLINLTRYTNIEWFAGARYNDFDENIVNEDQGFVANVNSSAYGALAGVQVNRTTKSGASLFARARAAILMDDGHVFDESDGTVTRLDTTQGMSEIAAGFEFATCLGPAVFKLTLAAEFQNWFNFSAAFDTGVNGNELDGSSDVGFGGLVVGVGLEY